MPAGDGLSVALISSVADLFFPLLHSHVSRWEACSSQPCFCQLSQPRVRSVCHLRFVCTAIDHPRLGSVLSNKAGWSAVL